MASGGNIFAALAKTKSKKTKTKTDAEAKEGACMGARPPATALPACVATASQCRHVWRVHAPIRP